MNKTQYKAIFKTKYCEIIIKFVFLWSFNKITSKICIKQ